MKRQRVMAFVSGLRAGFLAVLLGVTVVYFALPARAAEGCAWQAEMLEDEGGPVIKAYSCTDDSTASELYLMCGGEQMWLSYDLAKGGDRQPDSGEMSEVEFVTDGGSATASLQFQEMDGLFAGEATTSLIGLLKSESSVLIRDADSAYPAKTLSLRGSSAAITALAAACR